jgi:transcriptional regulator GlxA family with amidase domain
MKTVVEMTTIERSGDVENCCTGSRCFSGLRVLLAENRNRKTRVETETVSISRSPVEIYSFFRGIGHLNIDKAIDEANPADYVGVLVPGGAKSPAILAEDERILSFLREINGAAKMIAPICRGTMLVATSGVAKGKEITGFHLSHQYPELAVRPLVESTAGFGARISLLWSQVT